MEGTSHISHCSTSGACMLLPVLVQPLPSRARLPAQENRMNPGQLRGALLETQHGHCFQALQTATVESARYGKTSQVFSLQHLAHGAF